MYSNYLYMILTVAESSVIFLKKIALSGQNFLQMPCVCFLDHSRVYRNLFVSFDEWASNAKNTKKRLWAVGSCMKHEKLSLSFLFFFNWYGQWILFVLCALISPKKLRIFYIPNPPRKKQLNFFIHIVIC